MAGIPPPISVSAPQHKSPFPPPINSESYLDFRSALQEVIGALITHIGSGMPSEIDHALDALGALVETQGKAMQRFAILIKVDCLIRV